MREGPLEDFAWELEVKGLEEMQQSQWFQQLQPVLDVARELQIQSLRQHKLDKHVDEQGELQSPRRALLFQ